MIMYKIFSGLGVALMRYQVSMPEVMAFVARGVRRDGAWGLGLDESWSALCCDPSHAY